MKTLCIEYDDEYLIQIFFENSSAYNDYFMKFDIEKLLETIKLT